ncbi:MAG: aspartate kinase [Candidatus Thermoplasmatota archaeon]|nr:aspartate kinase [Candidatus Thermoplasmatota archaeon]
MKTKRERSNLDRVVSLYLTENPDILLSLRAGVVNVSKLALLIKGENKELNLISIRAALNRHLERRSSLPWKEDADLLLKKSKVSLQDKICVVTSKSVLSIKYISATFLQDSIVYIVDEMKTRIPHSAQGVSVETNVSMIHVLSPREIESTPGFVMRITHKLYSRGVNIIQLISCSNETIIITTKKDSTLSYEVLTM